MADIDVKRYEGANADPNASDAAHWAHARLLDDAPKLLAAYVRQQEEIERLREELDDERMRLAACTSAALANTVLSANQRLPRDHRYWSATYGDVCASVDREIQLRAEVAELVAALTGVVDAMEFDNGFGSRTFPRARAVLAKHGGAL